MLKDKIPFQKIESIPLLIKDFLDKEIPQFSVHQFSLLNIEEKAQKKSKTFSQEQREVLVEVLKSQFQNLNFTEKQYHNLNALLEENTFTITTGHQLNLFSGPVFFIYKILQTIKTAEFLSQNSLKKFVPIFWMATEDHDFEEIDHFKTPQNFYQIKAKSGGAVGRITLEDNSFLEEFKNEVKDDVFGTQLIMMAQKAYQKGNTLAEATRILVHELFSEWGLLIIDGDHTLLKNQMADIFSAELQHQVTEQSSKEDISFLTEKYGKVQVNPREINLFYLSETRDRILKNDNGFEISGTSQKFSFEELTSDWSKISPNALLRPVFQEKVLPNVAYIGGNAEIMYWLEMPKVFEAFRVDFPVLIPRNSMVFLSVKTFQKIEKSGMNIGAFFGDFQSKLNEKLLEESSLLEIIDTQEAQLKNNFQDLKEAASMADKTFWNLVEAEETRQLKSFSRMKKRLLRAEKIKQADRLDFFQRLFLEIHPSGNWQERVLNFSSFFAQNGPAWLETCYQEVDVDKSMLILMEY